MVIAVRELVDSGRVQGGASVFLETVPVPFLQDTPLVEGEWVWIETTGVPVFPTWYIGIAAALGAGVLAYLYRRRALGRKQAGI